MSQETVKPGKYVSISYTIRDEDDNVVEQHDLPIGFVYGSDTELIGGMDQAILGKAPGDEVEVDLPPQETFGEHDPNLTFVEELENVPPQFRHVGAEVQMQNEAGDTKTFYISRIEDDKVTIDGNHPLAGKMLKVHVKILEVRNAQPGEEQTSGIHSTQAPGSMTIN
ncbi:FKBP-type peptidyl-prolyl cis-trans isomerase [Thiolapillus brandeum]|uniref:Peptidyl-prolyl cis-trans isomerase n=1 Tax=Thiolapillus brandeum TaxID=1076588 RepID=A0A7U6JGW3_9GAMM|nr:FKBP-type peptidyl-prolyl cis-trans isomerase [Thiolapillus brandeum]BAO43178.1 FKBP-type peptidyl-prolyl cis-trans isomerase SlyD [Thiolapillus brandeum]